MAGSKFIQRILGKAGARFGTNSSNYTGFNSAGYQQMVGTAQVYKDLYIPAADFISNASAGAGRMLTASPLITLAGQTWHTYCLSASGDGVETYAEWFGFAPPDAATSGSVIPYIEVTPAVAIAAGSDLAKPILRYNYISTGAASTTTGSVQLATATCINPGTLGMRQQLTMPNIPSFAQNQRINFAVAFPANGASTTSGSYLGFVALRLRYVADRVGASGVS